MACIAAAGYIQEEEWTRTFFSHLTIMSYDRLLDTAN